MCNVLSHHFVFRQSACQIIPVRIKLQTLSENEPSLKSSKSTSYSGHEVLFIMRDKATFSTLRALKACIIETQRWHGCSDISNGEGDGPKYTTALTRECRFILMKRHFCLGLMNAERWKTRSVCLDTEKNIQRLVWYAWKLCKSATLSFYLELVNINCWLTCLFKTILITITWTTTLVFSRLFLQSHFTLCKLFIKV